MWLLNKDRVRVRVSVVCRLHELHAICHLNFYHLIFILSVPVSVSCFPPLFLLLFLFHFSFGCLLVSIRRLELFALICLLSTTNAFACNDSSTQEITLLTPHIQSHVCMVANVGCWFLSDVFISKRKTVMWLLWNRQMVFDSSSATNTVDCIQTTKYTWHTRYRDGENDNDGNSNINSNSSLYRMQVPIS